MLDLNQYCKNKPEEIISATIFYHYSFNHFEPDNEIIEAYKKWPCYNVMLYEVDIVKVKPERHRILQSEDINSCLRYISFNYERDKLSISAHFRSQNQIMQEYDKHYLCRIGRIFNKSDFIQPIIYNVTVDEFLIIK